MYVYEVSLEVVRHVSADTAEEATRVAEQEVDEHPNLIRVRGTTRVGFASPGSV